MGERFAFCQIYAVLGNLHRLRGNDFLLKYSNRKYCLAMFMSMKVGLVNR